MTKEDKKMFGKKVKCHKYLKLTRFNSVEIVDLEREIDEVYRNKRELVNDEFCGFVIGKANIITSYVFGLTYDDIRGIEVVCVDDRKYTKCYRVAYRNNKTRYVPIEYCEVINND